MRLNGSQILEASLLRRVSRSSSASRRRDHAALRRAARVHPMRHVLVRHEQGAAHMADGYARADGNDVGVCMGTCGPGATNLVTGILNAHMDSAPIVAITANVASHVIGTDAFQEADITGITIPVTKQNYFVRNTRDLPRVVKEAFHIARTGRPGPVHIDIPKDVLLARTEFELPDAVDLPGFQPTVEGNMAQIRKAARLIEQAERPVIIAGQGVLLSRARTRSCWRSPRRPDIPVVTTLLGHQLLPGVASAVLGIARHARLGLRRNYAVHNADLVIGIGMRFDDRACGKFSAFAPQRQDRPHRHRPGRDRQERAGGRADRRATSSACCTS